MRGGLPQLSMNPNAPQLRSIVPGQLLPSLDPKLLMKQKKEKKSVEPGQTQNILQLSPNSPTSPDDELPLDKEILAQSKNKKGQDPVQRIIPKEAPSMKDF